MNPYSTPSTPQQTPQHQQPEFKKLVIAWEKLRILYNGIMLLSGIITLSVLIHSYREEAFNIITLAFGFAIIANLCFFAGPVCEVYLRAFRNVSNEHSLRWTLLTLGCLVSLLPAIALFISPQLYQLLLNI